MVQHSSMENISGLIDYRTVMYGRFNTVRHILMWFRILLRILINRWLKSTPLHRWNLIFLLVKVNNFRIAALSGIILDWLLGSIITHTLHFPPSFPPSLPHSPISPSLSPSLPPSLPLSLTNTKCAEQNYIYFKFANVCHPILLLCHFNKLFLVIELLNEEDWEN